MRVGVTCGWGTRGWLNHGQALGHLRSVTVPCPCAHRLADDACGGGNGGGEQRHQSQVSPLRVSLSPRHPFPRSIRPQAGPSLWEQLSRGPGRGTVQPGQMGPQHGRANFWLLRAVVGVCSGPGWASRQGRAAGDIGLKPGCSDSCARLHEARGPQIGHA